MKKVKVLSLGLVLAISMAIGYFQTNPPKTEQIGAGVAYLAAKKGASNEATLFIAASFTIESSLQGLLWGTVYGGPVGAAVGLGIGL